MSEPLVRNVSDTALWVAVYRAHESERPGALFRDPYARRLAGTRGEEILQRFRNQKQHEWVYTIRTHLFDTYVKELVTAGADTVINLAAGLDARPYRMDLPPSLRWIEVDLPGLIAYKESILGSETPRCRLERIGLDLADRDARRALFARLGGEAKRAVILSEGLLIYLGAENARSLAEDLAAERSFRHWVIDINSPSVLKRLQRQVGKELAKANAPLLFGPPEGPWFFEPAGWRVAEVRSTLKTAVRLIRIPLPLRFFALFPEKLPPGGRPWAGICLLENARPAAT